MKLSREKILRLSHLVMGQLNADDGVEFLGQRRGVQAYITSGKTMGIPILYPWANRLSAAKYAIDGGVVTGPPGASVVVTPIALGGMRLVGRLVGLRHGRSS